ncbi:methionyl-tRNA synthetase [Scheffersomyces spartinae]|uniref:Methionine--tRNA ligase, mitochondrial n=1 Tax=Scheffersomyces spartinae TaxID=45513 RepID=A0A9P8AJG5_9ASCO|nr:methionyl-tRNA synthetase [Scheffersomyces spartinae]KAG7194760.1 methionyl-tRNA synthetase [Scheffersomyces spartinae]
MTRTIFSSAFRVLGRRYASQKPFYVTTPIFYVNASPHMGHLYSMLLCDVRIRWQKLNAKNNTTFFTTGTDEHGLKIQNAAEKQGVDPKQFVDSVSQNFHVLSDKMDIQYDRFIRTTDPDHMSAVQYVWKVFKEKGLIYEGSHEGWYCVSDETFYPEAQLEQVERDGKRIMISRESKNEVVYQKETNYFFKLARFQDQLIKFLEENPDFIAPKAKYEELLRELKDTKLSDLSISRPSSRLNWGIEVPDDPSQKIYVWLDALFNYVVSSGFPGKFPLLADGTYEVPTEVPWPATHVIGKDIIRFHCIYWPIFLMGLGLQLPKQVVVHLHWLCDGFKMSKSLGNVIDPILTQDLYGQDALRFFLTEFSNIESDCNFVEESFHNSRDHIIGTYANLITRIGGAAFNIEESVQWAKEGKYVDINSIIESHYDPAKATQICTCRSELTSLLDNIYNSMDERMVQFDYKPAIREWWGVLEKANLFVQLSEPWTFKKLIASNPENSTSYEILRHYSIYLALEASRIASILIQPVIPELASKLLDRLNVSESKRSAAQCHLGGDFTYGAGANSKTHKLPIQRIVPTEKLYVPVK